MVLKTTFFYKGHQSGDRVGVVDKVNKDGRWNHCLKNYEVMPNKKNLLWQSLLIVNTFQLVVSHHAFISQSDSTFEGVFQIET